MSELEAERRNIEMLLRSICVDLNTLDAVAADALGFAVDVQDDMLVERLAAARRNLHGALRHLTKAFEEAQASSAIEVLCKLESDESL